MAASRFSRPQTQFRMQVLPASAAMAAATVEATSTMESAARCPMEAAATMECVAAVESAADISSGIAAGVSTIIAATYIPTTHVPTSVVSRVAVVSAAIVATVPEPSRVTPVIPRSGTDENAIYEPVRTVVAVGSTGVWVIVIVAVRADRRSGDVARPNANADSPDPNANTHLGLRIREWNHQDCQNRNIFQVTHRTPCLGLARPSGDSRTASDLVVGFFFHLPPRRYLFERGWREKVAKIGLVDFSHPA